MRKQLDLVRQAHEKFKAQVSHTPSLVSGELAVVRHKLMHDEVQEYLEGVKQGDLYNVAKELADILYAVYGTILAHGLQDKMEEVFAEVHKSNMSKDHGDKKWVKGADYKTADVKSALER